MALVTMKEVLDAASEGQYAVGMFDVHNIEMIHAVIEAAEEEHAPVILALAEAHVKSVEDIEEISKVLIYAAEKAKVPVVVHYDHGVKREYILQVLKSGFTSVMYDGSILSFDENVKNTKEVIELAKEYGASVEAELGHVGQGEGGIDDGAEMMYTDVAEAKLFVEQTGIDALAVAIGTAHGVYQTTPVLDIGRLRDIRKNVTIPLVLHGGSGLSDEDFRACVDNGISKINIYTEIVQTAFQGLKDDLMQGISVNYDELMKNSTETMKQKIAARIRLFGSSGKA